uniref:NADH dehydrogenase subunit 6 n=1 Tax=Oxytelus varipennis TaxID=1336280 RepID=UPI002A7F0CB7|nr:NADH dehydrogenase subunit 6 [Oxytelus varipennis]WON66040.1 NADH dehydrogenase subunit 6 [Oxytelus varipennis]
MLMLMMNIVFMFLFSKHPITMGVMLLLQTLLTAMLMNSIIMNSWFSYILLLVMIGGLLILFIYMTSLVSNKKFKFNPMLMFIHLLIMASSIIIFMMDKFNFYCFSKSYMLMNYQLELNFNKFIMPSYLMMTTLIIYLLIVLIAVVKISSFKSGPLRQKF